MNIEKERKAFDDWHLKRFKDINCDLSDEDSTVLYRRVYSHEAQDLIRQMEFNSWLASANREGYKLVPVDKVVDCLNQIGDRSYIDDNVSELKAMIGACDD